MDLGDAKTKKEIQKLEKNIHEVYKQAEQDIDAKIKDFSNKFEIKNDIHLKQVASGEWTDEQYNNWISGQMFQSNQWQAKKEQIIQTMTDANSIATKMVNGARMNVFAYNANYQAYEIENGLGLDVGFGLYDSNTVVKLLKDNPQILPKWKINEEKDYVWNKKKVNSAITQGIVQGEKISQITDRLTQGLCSQNEKKMRLFARTGVTQAQNAGRYDRLMEAKQMGIDMVKMWMATLDGRTRDSHAAIDGETQEVGDTWHPMKFSNGCRFPGDPLGKPEEVYNCRCKLVGSLKNYNEDFERRDQLTGEPIPYMTYSEWEKTKASTVKIATVDYAKYGSKEALEVIQKYNYDWNKIVKESTSDEFDMIWSADGYTSEKAQEWIANAKADKNKLEGKTVKKKVVSEEEKAQKAYEKALKNLEDIEKEIKDKGADKVFKGIWKDDVTYADYDNKMLSIIQKEKYYKENIDKQADNFLALDLNLDHTKYHDLYYDFAKHDSLDSFLKDKQLKHKLLNEVVDKDGYAFDEDDLEDIWNVFKGSQYVKLNKTSLNYLKELDEFKTNGYEYSKLLKKRDDARSAAQSLKPKPDPGKAFGKDAYSQARKDAAVWAKSAEEADKKFRNATETVWKDASKDEKYAAWDYTAGSGKFNRPLRGYNGSWFRFEGVGNVPLDNEGAKKEIEDLTRLLEKSTMQHDTWLQRGVDDSGLAGFLQIDEHLLQNATQEELENALIGKEVSDLAFLSCGSSKGKGFSGNTLNLYCPQGTQALYVEPFSEYGKGSQSPDWDGTSKQSYYGSELETLLQRNTRYRVTKVEKSGYKMYIDVEVVGQDPWAIKYN